MTMEDDDPEVMAVRIEALTARVAKLEEVLSRVTWAIVASAALLVLEPLKSILFNGGAP